MRRYVCLLVVFACLLRLADGADWPAFRGPNGNGWSDEKNVPTEWGPEKNVKWKFKLPDQGNSSPIVVGDRVFITCAQEKGQKRGLYCLDRASGSELWSQVIGFDKVLPTHQTNLYCSPTLVSDGKRVVVWHGSAGLFCYDMAGQELWRRDDLGEFVHVWGYASSPIIYHDLVIQNCAPGKKAFLGAFDLATGRDVWRTDEPDTKNGGTRGTWSTPIVVKLDGADQVVVFQPSRVVSYKPETGEIIWFCHVENKKGDLATPVRHDICASA